MDGQHLIENLSRLSPNQIEAIEKLTLRWIFQATVDFGFDAYDIFRMSPDNVKDVAEDITREILDRLPGFNIQQRIFGTVDYKRARYIILPENMVRQALFVDSKAEKEARSATIQMSQTSMHIRQIRSNRVLDIPGQLPPIASYGGRQYLTTTSFLHFHYEDVASQHILHEVTIFSLPNGLLQDFYNPHAQDSIWLAGRNAPTLGEDFRVRLRFSSLKQKARWRVQKVRYDLERRVCRAEWED